jgi:hypothetical protein
VKSRIGMVVAAAALLSVGSLEAIAGEPQFQAPATDRARETQTLLTQAAVALNAGVPLAAGEHISNLWLFPTADADTVFAQYGVTNGRTRSKSAASQGHLELIKLSGDRIVEERDLTRTAADSSSYAKQPRAGLDVTAFIGTGHATGTPVTSAATHGSPASPHWSASIGNGHTSSDAVQRPEVVVNARTAAAPSAHWTSKIGTGHAVDSGTSVQNEAGRVTASLVPQELNSY